MSDDDNKTIKVGNLEAIAFHLEQGEDNGGITREALAAFLRGVADELKSNVAATQIIAASPGSNISEVKQTIIK